MAGTEIREETPTLKEALGRLVEAILLAAINAVFLMLIGGYLLERFSVSNPGFIWWLGLTALISVVTQFVVHTAHNYRKYNLREK